MIIHAASFPRSGNSFFQSIMFCFAGGIMINKEQTTLYGGNNYFHKNVQQALGLDIPSVNPVPEEMHVDDSVLVICKDHQPASLCKPGNPIGIVRDGRDCLLSYCYFNSHNQGCTFDEVLKDMLRGLAIEEWVKHVLDLKAHENTIPVLRYENMLSKPVENVAWALSKCGVDARKMRDCPTFDEVTSLVSRGEKMATTAGVVGRYKHELPSHAIEEFNKRGKEGLEAWGY